LHIAAVSAWNSLLFFTFVGTVENFLSFLLRLSSIKRRGVSFLFKLFLAIIHKAVVWYFFFVEIRLFSSDAAKHNLATRFMEEKVGSDYFLAAVLAKDF
jgi:hypothetical protein